MRKKGNSKILVVDGDADVQRRLESLFAAAGFEVFQAFSGGQAIDYFVTEKPDLIVLDLELGTKSSDINGFDLTRFIKKVQNDPAPIVIYSDRKDRIDGVLKYGVSIFVSKSAPDEEIQSVVYNLLENSPPRAVTPPQGGRSNFQ